MVDLVNILGDQYIVLLLLKEEVLHQVIIQRSLMWLYYRAVKADDPMTLFDAGAATLFRQRLHHQRLLYRSNVLNGLDPAAKK